MRLERAFFLAHGALDPGGLPPEGWREVALPHQWALEGLEAEVGWYRLSLPPGGPRRFLRAWGDYFQEAWLEGRYLGRHEGYFLPWTLELPPGEVLYLRVSAPKEPPGQWPRFKRQIKGVLGQHDCRPGGSGPRGQERGTGGLWGGVEVLFREGVALLGLTHRLHPRPGGWRLLLRFLVDAPGPFREAVRLRLRPENFPGEALEKTLILEGEGGRAWREGVWDLPEMPLWEVWERGFPHLFRLEAELLGANATAPLGFRTVALDGEGWLLLNGRRLFLRGTNHIPTQWLAGYTEAQAQRDVALLKEAHLNAVRIHAHVTHPAFYQACDREGVLIWQDFPLQWGYAPDEAFAQEALRQARGMVDLLGAHPSLYLWCAQNEPTHNRHALGPLLGAALRAQDPTRPVKEASDFREHPYPGWYWGHYRDFLALPGSPLPSEFGAQALPRAELLRRVLGEAAWPPQWEVWAYHNFQPHETFRVAGVRMGESLEAFVENSQAYQARLLEFAIHAYRRAKGRVVGYFQFLFAEPWEGITWAVLDVERVPKKGFFALKEASSPVLLSLIPYREAVEVGGAPLQEAWLVSDLERPLTLWVHLRLEGPENLDLFHGEVGLAPGEVRRFFSLGELWESPLEVQARWQPLQEALRRLPPGAYRLVGEAWEEERLWSRHVLELTYLEPLLPLEAAW
ncbi:glycoside hydrolase family 2 TIM barrel-domain containing protein [Thermus sp.]|uniref:glycoside hydrolase family 2 TIM barrel-domain containing protein n=1 Tax=Thermus sp. TaxID=275 RepID=UPI0026173C52|nr:glycoside hydrolase family 2 TIM barrel-domain containing protein [Thermus sp.]MCX7849742.1 beta-galactosidase [Thermus sp.]MDW8017037.1 glycoside hydrolase family 2 TIM barrel-domain containing protein [Thermus sp.]